METGRFQPAIEHGANWPGTFRSECLSVSFVRAAYGAFPSQITYMILLTKTIPERISAKLIQVPSRINF
nr:hypothetical protein [Desulfitobacterium dehalogenans]